MTHPLFTIGHSHHEPEEFVPLLKRHGVAGIADVRSQPYSQLHPFYNREILKTWLKDSGIDYVFLGRELGARREEPECYVGDQARYDLIAGQPLFLQGIERLLTGLQKQSIAMLCAEKDPLDCHRFVLIARHLRDKNIAVINIMEDGGVETLAQSEKRLLEKTGVVPDLFNWEETEAARIEQAYDKRALEIAYRRTGEKA